MVTKKKPVKKATKKVVKASPKRKTTKKQQAQMKSFHLYKEEKPFIRMSITRQTVYWAILLAFIIISQLWILKIQMDIANLTSIVIHQ